MAGPFHSISAPAAKASIGRERTATRSRTIITILQMLRPKLCGDAESPRRGSRPRSRRGSRRGCRARSAPTRRSKSAFLKCLGPRAAPANRCASNDCRSARSDLESCAARRSAPAAPVMRSSRGHRRASTARRRGRGRSRASDERLSGGRKRRSRLAYGARSSTTRGRKKSTGPTRSHKRAPPGRRARRRTK